MLKKVFNKAVLGGLAMDFVTSPIRIHRLVHDYSSKVLESKGYKIDTTKHKSLAHAFASCVSVPAGLFQVVKGALATTAVVAGVGVISLIGAAASLFLMSPLMLHFMEAMLFKFSDCESKYGMVKQGSFPGLRAAWYKNAVKPIIPEKVEPKFPKQDTQVPELPLETDPKLKIS